MSVPDSSVRWEELEQRLLSPKIGDLADEMHKRIAQADREIAFEVAQSGNRASYLPRLFDFHEQLAKQWAERLYAAHCEVWHQQNRCVTGEFIRLVRDQAIIPLIEARKGTVQFEVSLRATRIRERLNSSTLGEWYRRMDRLAAHWNRKLEAEAVAIEYRTQAQQQLPLPDLLKLASGLRSPDPIEQNPFRPEDPRHPVWEDASRSAEQEISVLNAAGIAVAHELPQPSTQNEARSLVFARVNYLACAKYDIWAKRGIQVVWSDDAIHAYDQWLADYANAWLNTVKAWRSEMDGILPELRLRLIGRMEFWKSEARRYVAEQKAGALATGAEVRMVKEDRPSTPKRTILGSNIDKFRKECGWSFNDLAERTGLDKKLILGHVNRGKGIRPNTLKIYADAFGGRLERKVLVAELES